MSTKVITGKVRFSYVNVFEPDTPQDGGEPKYSVTLLIPKTDTATIGKIKEAMKEAREIFCNKNGANSLPANPAHTLKDGDKPKDNGDEYGPECKGCYVIRVKSKDKPVVVDEFGNEISGPGTVCANPSAVYSGCYGRASIKFYGYNTKGSKGISAVLLGIKKLHDGEPLGGTFGSAADFEDDWVDTEAGVDDDFMG